ncbi:MAG: hypothetical protein ACETWR_25940 [Anaerolineae bacterium]
MPQYKKSVPVKEIVNFDEQIDLFKKMLADPTERRLMFIRAAGGRGKTCLLRLMRRCCEEQGIPSCWVDFRGEPYDSPHLTLARHICQELHLSPRHLAETLWPLSVHALGARDVSARVEGDVTSATIITAGRDVYQCEQVVVHVSPTNESLHQPYMRDRLKQAFCADLTEMAAAEGEVVCFFDSLEDISGEEEGWLLEALLCPTAEGELKDVIVVTAGRRWPPELEEWDWEHHAHLVPKLPLMDKQQVKEFARRVGYEITEAEVEFCWRACRGGIPLYMGMVVKNLRAKVEVRP